ncbi:MAG: DUF2007 domain-containing protein [Clostridiaceae bacterium]|nr:DUF2007 domain-containing protein [Clostridiaceae bacterium]
MFLKKKAKKAEAPEGMEFLLTTSDNIEAEIIGSYLKPAGIPVVKRHREPGAYLTLLLGNSSYGVDLFVPSDKLEEALELIESAKNVRDEDILADPSFNDEVLIAENEEFLKKLDKKVGWMAAIFLAVVAILIYLILTNL